MSNENQPLAYSPDGLATKAETSVRTIYNAIEAEELEAHKIGRLTRITHENAMRWLTARKWQPGRKIGSEAA